jgi:hypothetical protein
MDFIEQLPDSSSYTVILIIIDHLSKQAIFVPTHDTITSLDLTRLFLLHVFSKHRIPSHVTSGQGMEFVSHFFCSLGKALNMILHFTSGYHPEGDGQTEQANQTLEQYLHIYCNYQQETGQNSFHWQNSHIITLRVLPLEFHHSWPIRVII